MPFVRVRKTKFLIKQLLILTPLSLSGLFLATQVFNSISSSSRNQNVSVAASAPAASSAPVAARRSAPAPSARTGTPLSGTSTPNPGDPFGGGNPAGTPTDPVGAVPVDGGLAFLLAAGIGYGARKKYQFRFPQKNAN
jgi:hypothetical protein